MAHLRHVRNGASCALRPSTHLSHTPPHTLHHTRLSHTLHHTLTHTHLHTPPHTPHPAATVRFGQRRSSRQCPSYFVTSSYGFSTASKSSSANEAEQENTRREEPSTSHVYKDLYPWNTKASLLDTLLKEPLLDNEHLLALHKPYGLARAPTPGTRRYGAAPPRHLCLDTVMPELRQAHGKEVELFSAPEKWNSGVMLFAKTQFMANLLERCAGGSRNQCVRGFLCVVRHPPHCKRQPPVKRATQQQASSALGPQLVKSPGINQMKRQEVDGFTVQHEVLCEGGVGGAAVVEVSVSSTRHNSVRTYLTHHTSPVLGDHLFAPRLAYILGRPYLLPLTQVPTSRAQPYPFELVRALELRAHTADLLPLLLHHHRRVITGFFSRLEAKRSTAKIAESFVDGPWVRRVEDDLVLECPPPPHFTWTLERLGLHLNAGAGE